MLKLRMNSEGLCMLIDLIDIIVSCEFPNMFT